MCMPQTGGACPCQAGNPFGFGGSRRTHRRKKVRNTRSRKQRTHTRKQRTQRKQLK